MLLQKELDVKKIDLSKYFLLHEDDNEKRIRSLAGHFYKMGNDVKILDNDDKTFKLYIERINVNHPALEDVCKSIYFQACFSFYDGWQSREAD